MQEYSPRDAVVYHQAEHLELRSEMEEQKKQIGQQLKEGIKKKKEDILWSGNRTIKEAYSQISDQYSDLAKRLETFGKSDLVESANTISRYYRIKANRVEVDTPLSFKILTPGWGALRILSDLPEGVLSEIEQDKEGSSSPSYKVSVPTLREIGYLIVSNLKEFWEEESPSLFPEAPSMEDKDDYLIGGKLAIYETLYVSRSVVRYLREGEGKVSPRMNKRIGESIEFIDQLFVALVLSLYFDFGDITIEEAKKNFQSNSQMRDFFLPRLIGITDIFEVREINGKKRIIENKSEDYSASALEAFEDLKKIEKSSKVGQTNIPKDLLETMISSKGDTCSLLQQDQGLNDEQKEIFLKAIQKHQKQGKLLRGTMEGLAGGTAYFHIFIIALAQTLNEQSKFYKTEERGSGVPLDLVRKYTGQDVKLLSEEEIPVFRGGDVVSKEIRAYPYVLLSYDAIAKKTKGTDKISGGRDSEFVREYIETLQNKEYLIWNKGGGIIGLPIIHREASLYNEKTGKEVGCILRLSPQFSKTIRGYSGLRSDTIKRLGGGKQKDITMRLLDTLIYARGIGAEYRRSKEALLSAIATGKRYERSKQKREEDFKEATQKMEDALIIIKYKEERGKGGEIQSVFVFNPDYSKGEEIPEIDEQKG